MTFLNPLVLIGLAAAALPVLFHLFAQRRARRVEFSSLRFLQKLEKTSMRAVKIRQILLLIVRTLLVIAIVMAFARPALQGYMGNFFGSSHANSTIVILLDNSASMSRSNERGELFKQSKDAAREIGQLIRDGDEAIVIPIASIERGNDYKPVHSQQEILQSLQNTPIVDRPAQLNDGLRLASSILAQSSNVNKEVFLISDGQARNLVNTENDVPQDTTRQADTAATIRLFDDQTKIFYSVFAGGEVGSNLSLDSIKALTTVYEPGRPVDFALFVRNTGTQPVENGVISLFYNEERVAQRTLTSVAAGQTERVTIQGPARGSGVIAVRAELETDALPFDNKRYTVVTIPSTRRISIFTQNTGDFTFTRLALEQTLTQNGSLPFTVDVRGLSELTNLAALGDRLDAVMIGVGSEGLSDQQVATLREYVTSGRGATIFLMPGIDPAKYNQSVAGPLRLPQIKSKDGSSLDNSRYVSFAQVDLAHPFFSGLFAERGSETETMRGIESPRIYEYYTLTQGGLPLIRLSSGSPFLVESEVGKGRVLQFVVPPTQAFSDFPTKSIFLPLVRRAAAYTSSIRSMTDENRAPQFVTTEPLSIELPELAGEQAGSTVMIKAPDGSTSRSQLVASSDGRMRISLEQAPLAGNYFVYRDAEARDLLTTFAVNIESSESDLTQASDQQIEEYLERRAAKNENVRPLSSERDITKTITESRFGAELWQAFLGAAIALAIIEMLLARVAKREVA